MSAMLLLAPSLCGAADGAAEAAALKLGLLPLALAFCCAHGFLCRAAGGAAEAAALEVELLRVAALHAVQHVQGALQAAVK